MSSRNANSSDQDILSQLTALRDQVSQLADRAAPALRDAAGRAQDTVRQQSETVAAQVRERPLGAVLIAAAAGYLLGRITR